MSTPAQLTANRANARHSTGPTTKEGKTRSAQNHFRHGLAGRFVLIDGEKQSEFYDLVIALRKEHEATTPTEFMLVERMAQHWWLTQRAIRLQNDCFNPDSPASLEIVAVYLRYQTTHERAFSRSLHDLLHLRAERRRDEAHTSRQALDELKRTIGFERQRDQQAARERREQLDRIKQNTAQLTRQIQEMDAAPLESAQLDELLRRRQQAA